MRMVWLALFCLIGLAITVVVKIGMSPYASGDVSRAEPFANAEVSREISLSNNDTGTVVLSSENVTAETKLQDDTLAKADKLEVSYTNEAAPEIRPVKSVAIGLPTTEPKQISKKRGRMVSRHWHDPFDKRHVPAAAQPPTKRKVSNTSTNRSPMVTARAPKS
jgi:hypothetical protein